MKTRPTNLSPNAKPWAPYSGGLAHTNSGGGGNNNNGSGRSHYTQYRSGGLTHHQAGGKGNNSQQRNTLANHNSNPFRSPAPTSVGQKQQQQAQYARPKLSPTAAKLFVGQLPFECTEERMCNLFSAYGTVEHIHILRDNSNRSRGAAFVTYSTVQEADTAIFTLHNRYRMLTNRAIQVSYAKNSPNISRFGACNAKEVHDLFPTNPVPDVAATARVQANSF